MSAVGHPPGQQARRPLKSRGSRAIRGLAAGLARRGVKPNAISVAGVVFAAGSAGALLAAAETDGALRAALLVVAAGGIQLRLLCNLLDGLVAVEGRLGGPDGELFNDFPDRLADTAVLLGAGYAVGVPELGWAAALAAVLTAYVRVLGGAIGVPQDFSGIMAKPRRMALMTAACLAAIVAWTALTVALALVAAGSALTVGGRLLRVRRALL